MWLTDVSLKQARSWVSNPATQKSGLFAESLGISNEERLRVAALSIDRNVTVDPVVSSLIGATNGLGYQHLIGKLEEYPVPEIRLPQGKGQTILDIGCNWGRWCIAAARKGYAPIGIDPSLGAIAAARRVAKQLGVEVKYLVGDGRFLPFKRDALDHVFSYSVLQHLDREDAANVLGEIARVLKPEGTSLIQMPTRFGLRCLYHQARRKFRQATGFEVRYWSIPSLRKLFSSRIGSTEIQVDSFFSIGLQNSDMRLMPIPYKLVMLLSEGLRRTSPIVRPLIFAADSVYLSSVKR
jgi:ubiquinone/menaquinone biosynthesis C-methylase UbiE